MRSYQITTLAGSALLLALSGCFGGSDESLVAFERGNLLAERGQLEEAVNEYAKALKGRPDDPQIFFRRGLCYERLELSEKALEDYSACLEREPAHTDAINNRGVVLAKLQRFDEAAVQFSDLLQYQPENVLALRNRGLCYHDIQQFDKALADYDAALAIEPNNVDSWFQRGNVFLEQAQFAEAVENFSKAIESDQSFAKAWMNRGVARFGLNDRVAGMQDLQEAQDRDSNIVIPAIDWEGFRDAAEIAPVTELAVAKPVIDPGVLAWDDCRATAEAFLRDKGFADLVILDETPQYRCARIRAKQEDALCDVYIGCQLSESKGNVTLPAIVDDEDVRTMLLVVRSPSDADATAEVDRFVEDWATDQADHTPVLFAIPAE